MNVEQLRDKLTYMIENEIIKKTDIPLLSGYGNNGSYARIVDVAVPRVIPTNEIINTKMAMIFCDEKYLFAPDKIKEEEINEI